MQILNMVLLHPVLAFLVIYVFLVYLAPQGRIVPVLSGALAGMAVLLSMAYITANHFTGKGIDESVFFHLEHALNLKVILQFYQWVLLFSGVVVLVFCGGWWVIRRQRNLARQERSRHYSVDILLNLLCLSCATLSVIVHPAVHDIYNVLHERYLLRGEDVLAGLLKESGDNFEPINPKNFVYLYIESLDQIFFDEQRFPGLVPELGKLLAEGQRIGGLYQAPMTGWTMSGMVSSQCGLPLARMASRTSFDAEQRARTECIGDVLSEQGYYLSYMGGADSTFAGKGNFYLNHGFDEVLGAAELDELAGRSLDRSIWGVYDDDLFALALERFETIASTEKRFGLVLLTLDTHPPHGHETPSCKGLSYGDGNSGVLNAVHCADKVVTQFIRSLLSSPYASDLVLVVSSDHIMMGNDAGIQRDDGARENTFVYFNVDSLAPVERTGTMLDVAPTTLHLLGFKVSDMALGRNLFSDRMTLAEEHGQSEFYRLILVWRNKLMKAWSE